MGWLAMLSCAPLIFCQVRPPLPMVTALWALAGAGGAYQLAAAAAFIRALPRAQQVRAFAVAQAGLLAAQVLGILAAGAVAQRLGPQTAVTLAGLLGLVAAAVLATDWIHRHAEVLALLDAPYHQLTGRPDQLTGRPDQLTGRPDQLTGRPDQLTGRPDQPEDRPDQPEDRPDQPDQPAASPPSPPASRPAAGQPAAAGHPDAPLHQTAPGSQPTRPARPPMPASIAPAATTLCRTARCACRVRCSAAGAPTGRRGTCPGKPG